MEEESLPKENGDTSSLEIITTPPEYQRAGSLAVHDEENECNELSATKLSNSGEEDPHFTVHPFDLSNITVIENTNLAAPKSVSCEGSDSGVEVFENSDNFAFRRTLSSNSGVSNNFKDFENVQSCDSSISYCSNIDDAFNILVRRNSSLFGDCTLRNGDRTSDNSSESSSVTGSSFSKNSKRNQTVKKHVTTIDPKLKPSSPQERARSKPPVTPKSQANSGRLKSLYRLQGKSQSTSATKTNYLRSKQVPNNLEINKRDTNKRSSTVRTPSTTRTPIPTPTDDGRWPSCHSRPAPLLSKSTKGNVDSFAKRSAAETKTIEKYATLPRRKKEKSADDIEKPKRITDKDMFTNRVTSSKKSVPRETSSMRISTLGRRGRIKIYQENSIQTAVKMEDIDKILSGQSIRPASPEDKEFVNEGIQVDMSIHEVEDLKEQLRVKTEKYESLNNVHKIQTGKLREIEEKWRVDILEKEGLQQELKNNTDRVLTILGDQTSNDENSSDSLLVLESRYQDVRSLVIDQEKEISRLNALCRTLRINLDQSMMNQGTLIQQHQELEAESMELQEFMQAEKSTLADALREAETEHKKLKALITEQEKGLVEKQEESKHLVRLSEKRRQENLALQAKLGAMEAKCRDLLVQQRSSVSRAAIAVSSLSSRLDSLADELITSYNISELDLEDVIFHNEVFNYSSDDTTPEKGRKALTNSSPSSMKGSSFVSAVKNAIKNKAPFSRDFSRSNLQTETSSSNEMLDSETEPCLMMEHVLEDVVVPDYHSQNMISSTHSMTNTRLTHSESLKDLSQAILNREKEQANSLLLSFASEFGGDDRFSVPLLDQVIDVDNSITRLLRVIKIVQVDSEDRMNEMEDQRECYSEQINKQKETNKFVVKQLKDWELLGARLKGEIEDLKERISKKDSELEKFKIELNKQRKQLEKQNQDVCELSTALSTIELDAKMKREEVNEAISLWERTGEIPSQEIMGIIMSECPEINELIENEQQREDLKRESSNRHILIERIREAFAETKKQYEAIDNALAVLHNVQSVVQRCPPLAKLQRDLEEISFQSSSKMPLGPPPDLNANAALLQVIENSEVASPINTTA